MNDDNVIIKSRVPRNVHKAIKVVATRLGCNVQDLLRQIIESDEFIAKEVRHLERNG